MPTPIPWQENEGEHSLKRILSKRKAAVCSQLTLAVSTVCLHSLLPLASDVI